MSGKCASRHCLNKVDLVEITKSGPDVFSVH